MSRMHAKLSTAVGAALALGIAMAATPVLAGPIGADLWYSTTGAGGWVEVSSANTGGVGNCATATNSCGTGLGTFTSADGEYRINANVFTNAPGTSTLAITTNSSFTIQDLHAAGTGGHDIWFVGGGIGFTLPTGSLLRAATSGTTVTGIAGGSYSTFACIRNDNIVDAGSSCDSAGNLPDYTTSTSSGTIPGGPTTTWPDFPAGTIGGVHTDGEFGMIDELRLTLMPGEEITFSSNATLTPVPEPASLLIFGSALLGFGLIRRRRRS